MAFQAVVQVKAGTSENAVAEYVPGEGLVCYLGELKFPVTEAQSRHGIQTFWEQESEPMLRLDPGLKPGFPSSSTSCT